MTYPEYKLAHIKDNRFSLFLKERGEEEYEYVGEIRTNYTLFHGDQEEIITDAWEWASEEVQKYFDDIEWDETNLEEFLAVVAATEDD